MAGTELYVGKRKVTVVMPDDLDKSVLSPEDIEMDERVAAAVRSAIKKAEECKAPIAKYDTIRKKAYLEYSNGEKKYVSCCAK